MTLRYLILLMPLALAATAMAADSEDRTYPLDDAPACMQRDENGAAIRCVLRGSRVREQLVPLNVDDANDSAVSPPAMFPSEPPVSPIAIANLSRNSQ
jgi:hypothetical protein